MVSLFTRDVSWKTSGKCGAPADLNICTELQLHCTTAAEVILVGNKKKNTQKRILQKVANVTTVWIFKDVYDGLPQTVCTSVAAEEEGTVKSEECLEKVREEESWETMEGFSQRREAHFETEVWDRAQVWFAFHGGRRHSNWTFEKCSSEPSS